MNDDTIYRQAALDAIGEQPLVWTDDDDFAQGKATQWEYDIDAIKALPSAQPERLTDDEKAMIEFAENVIKDCVLLLMNEGGEKKTAFDFRYKDGKLYRMMVKEIGEE